MGVQHDDRYVFCGSYVLPKAKPERREKLASWNLYSRSDRIYYLNKAMDVRDPASFEVIGNNPDSPFAKDKFQLYYSDLPRSEEGKSYFADMFERG